MIAWLERACRTGSYVVSLIMAVLAIYVTGIALIDEGMLRIGAVGLAGLVMMLSDPLAMRHREAKPWLRNLLWLVDALLLCAFVLSIGWFLRTYESLWEGLYILPESDLYIALAGIVAVIELTRRAFGPVLAGLCALAIVYGMFGASLPWFFAHVGYSFEETMRAVWYSFDGVFGFPVGIIATIVVIFVVFGALLEGTGAGAILIKMATAATARIRGGPAHAAVLASALFGTISGSPIANVVGTGVFTIPLIKRQGFTPAFAGAVEAAASSAGQFTPPIMGAVAFVMAELVGVPYLTVAAAAVLPALFYFLCLFAAVYTESVRLGIGTVPEAERPTISWNDWLQSLRFIVPVVVVLAVLFAGRSPAAAGFWALITAVGVGLALDADLRRNPMPLVRALARGGRQCGQIIIAVAAIGIVIGIINMTGVGLRFAVLLADLAKDSLFLGLIVAMASCLVLGMGLPTIPAYLIIVLILGPAIAKLGVPLLIVHLFVLYYGVLSNITPPVALAAYAAAPIAQSNPLATGFQAVRIAAIGFLIPFVFVYNPSLVLVLGVDWLPFLGALFRLILAIWLVATGTSGVGPGRLGHVNRVARFVSGLVMLTPYTIVQVTAVAVGGSLVLAHFLRQRRTAPT
ncbi:MAG: TRAP transporter fused permease subunit [Betaproteobacteria bacterium]|nr:TRAP transporter fused permease subunit [Betaproteobacteria bacterium]